jgi:hypothetical protein
VLGCETLQRTGKTKVHLKHGKNQDNPANEARRWVRVVNHVHGLLDGSASAVHVMDREADDYALLAEMTIVGCQFVVRQYCQRAIDTEQGRRDVRDTLHAEFTVERDAKLSRRRGSDIPRNLKRHPARSARTAKLALRTSRVTIPRPRTASKSSLVELTLNLVHVLEQHPPAGC